MSFIVLTPCKLNSHLTPPLDSFVDAEDANFSFLLI